MLAILKNLKQNKENRKEWAYCSISGYFHEIETRNKRTYCLIFGYFHELENWRSERVSSFLVILPSLKPEKSELIARFWLVSRIWHYTCCICTYFDEFDTRSEWTYFCIFFYIMNFLLRQLLSQICKWYAFHSTNEKASCLDRSTDW